MPRRKSEKESRRVQLRISDSLLGVFDSYSPAQLSELIEWSLSRYIPGSTLGARQVAIIRPQKPISKVVCRLFVAGNQIKLLFPELRDEFRDVVKPRRYKWDKPCWVKEVDEKHICDRAAEVAHALLEAGFSVQSEYEGVTQAAISESYNPESLRLICARASGLYKGWLAVTWPRTEDYYEKAKAITAAKYHDGEVIIPPELYEEVLDFAESYDFSVTPEAEVEIQSMRQSVEIGFIPSKKQRRQRAEKTAEIEGIPESLLDED